MRLILEVYVVLAQPSPHDDTLVFIQLSLWTSRIYQENTSNWFGWFHLKSSKTWHHQVAKRQFSFAMWVLIGPKLE